LTAKTTEIRASNLMPRPTIDVWKIWNQLIFWYQYLWQSKCIRCCSIKFHL